MWRCRRVPDPWGGRGPATEILLIHCEDIKVGGAQGGDEGARQGQEGGAAKWGGHLEDKSVQASVPDCCCLAAALLPSSQVPERLTRLSVKLGMDAYVRRMGHAARCFVRDRRARGLAPDQHDPMRWAWAVFGGGGRGRGRGRRDRYPVLLGDGEEARAS